MDETGGRYFFLGRLALPWPRKAAGTLLSEPPRPGRPPSPPGRAPFWRAARVSAMSWLENPSGRPVPTPPARPLPGTASVSAPLPAALAAARRGSPPERFFFVTFLPLVALVAARRI